MAQNDRDGKFINFKYAHFAWTVTVVTVTVKVTVMVTVTVIDCDLTSDEAW